LIQNLYWLDLSGIEPVFISSFSRELTTGSTLAPPGSEEAEDLVFDFINELDRGELVFPDPYTLGAERRYKIVLCPVLDANGLLVSVIGIEADMEYLKLAEEFRKTLAQGVLLALLMSFIVSLLLAGNVAAKIAVLSRNTSLIAEGRQPETVKLSIKEFDELYQAFVKMAADLETQRAHVKRVFTRKLDELAFTGGAIAHEIRNPLSAIEMHFGLLKRSLQKLSTDPAMSEPLDEIDQQLQHLRRLVTSFLNYSRKVEPHIEKVALAEFCEKLISAKKRVLGDFYAEIDVAPDLVVSFDLLMMQQVFENLLNNSYRACGDKLRFVLTGVIKDSILHIEVSDNGPGIPETLRGSLFTPFASGSADGNGFGLALSRKLIEAHGGEIFHKDVSGAGALFVIEVPQHENSGR
jgi:signal transduction histidine kinase